MGRLPKKTATQTKQYTGFQNLNCVSEQNFLDEIGKVNLKENF